MSNIETVAKRVEVARKVYNIEKTEKKKAHDDRYDKEIILNTVTASYNSVKREIANNNLLSMRNVNNQNRTQQLQGDLKKVNKAKEEAEAAYNKAKEAYNKAKIRVTNAEAAYNEELARKEELTRVTEEAKRVEAARVEAKRVEAKRVEAARVEAKRVEAARVATEEAARVEAARVEAERATARAARVEAERATAKAARVEAARVEAARVEAARVEAARVEAARVEAARVAAARVAAEKAKTREAARVAREAKEKETQRLVAHAAALQATAQVANTRQPLQPLPTNLNREQIENYLMQQKNALTDSKVAVQTLDHVNTLLDSLSAKHKHSIHLILLSLYDSNVQHGGEMVGGANKDNWLNDIGKKQVLHVTGINALSAHKILIQDGVLLDLLKLHVEKDNEIKTENLRFTISNNGNVNIINGDTNEIVTSYIHENIGADTFDECSKLKGADSQRHCIEALGMMIGFFDSGDIKLGFFDNVSEEQKLSDSRAILKKLKWSVQIINGKHSIVTFDELSTATFKVERSNKDVKNTLTYLGYTDDMITAGNFLYSTKPNLVAIVKEAIKIINRYPDIINVLGTQKFTEVKPRKFSRMSGLDLARRRIQNIMSPLLKGGMTTYGVQEGGSQMSFATVFESKIDRILYILQSQGKRLSDNTMIIVKGKINTIRNLENELNEFLNKFEKYVKENPNDGLKNIDESTINKLNVVSKQLGRQVVSMSNGIIKITNYLPSVVPKKSYNRM